MIDVAIVGAGPCGLAAAISARRAGLDALVFDAECVVSSITQYPDVRDVLFDGGEAVVRRAAVRHAGREAIAA